jgi:hypothetical protein
MYYNCRRGMPEIRKRLSYAAKFKHEVDRCTEKKGHCKAAAFLELMKTAFGCGGNSRQRA